MKRIILALVSSMIIIFGVVALMVMGSSPATEVPPPATSIENNTTLNLDVIIPKYILTPENALGDSFAFTGPEELSSQTLFDFFLCAIGTVPSLYTATQSGDGIYHIPTAAVDQVLNSYFVNCNFEPSELSNYNAAEDTIDLSTLGSFNQTMSYVLRSAHEEGNNVTITVNLSRTGDSAPPAYSKTYNFLKSGQDLKYVSVSKEMWE